MVLSAVISKWEGVNVKPKISVIIPTLNEEKYIESTLFHIKKQKPFEIIVADSYSKDKTVKIAKKYGAKIVFVKRKNAAAGRNAGAKVARGDILLFLDADTIAFANLLSTIEKDFSHRGTVGWTCAIYAFSPSWKEHLVYSAFNHFVQSSIAMKRPKAAGIVIAVRKDVFDKIGGFNENMDVFEDFDFCLKTKKFGGFRYSGRTCVYTSTRRIQRWGILSSIKRYTRMYLRKMIRNEKFLYEPVR